MKRTRKVGGIMSATCCDNQLCVCNSQPIELTIAGGQPGMSWIGSDPFIGGGWIPSTTLPGADDIQALTFVNKEDRDFIVSALETYKSFFTDCGCNEPDKCSACHNIQEAEAAIEILLGPEREKKRKKEAKREIDKEIKEHQQKIRELESRKAEL